ncbi:MAG TPA: SMC-Scp complex subunit ScpB [Acidimicrobiales bacterium]
MSDETRRAIEAILMVADHPVDPHLLAQVTETAPAVMETLLAEMATAYEHEQRGFVLVKVAGGYRYQSHPDLTGYVERFVLEGQSARLSSAALETLAIVAYKQPISRAQVASIRGVNVDGVIRTLEQRGYIAEIARDPGPGQAVLFGTTALFLERLGLGSLEDLPPIAAFVPGADVVEALEVGLRAEPEVILVEPDVVGPAPDQPSGDQRSDDGG